jgi:carbonic anhydrase
MAYGSTSRRALLTLGSGAAINLAFDRGAAAQGPPTPETALAELMAGNQRFASNRPTHHEHDLEILKQHTVEKQEPFAGVLSCADSRVPIELIFDQSIGHIFVTRIAGNVVSPEIIASLEYGAAVLGTKVILVIGHSSCGAVKATMDSTGAPGQISALYPRIQQAVDQAGPNLDAAIRANAKIQAALLRKSSTVVSSLLREKKLLVKAAYYDLASGKVTSLE